MNQVAASIESGLPEGRFAYLDEHLREAIAVRTKPHAHVALRALHYLSGPEMAAIERLPLDNGTHQPGSKNLLSLALYALFLQDLRRDAFLVSMDEEQTITEMAAELIVYNVRRHLADARTIQDLQRVMGYEAVGRTDLSPGDRTAWALTWRALYRIGHIPEPDERSADSFTTLLMTAETWLRDGLSWTREKDDYLFDLAQHFFLGVAVPSVAAVALNREQDAWARQKFPSLFHSYGSDFADLLNEFVAYEEQGQDSGHITLEFLPSNSIN